MSIWDWQAVGVDVIMAPQRSRTVISFRDKSFTAGDPTIRPHLTIFEHTPGARVYEVACSIACVKRLLPMAGRHAPC